MNQASSSGSAAAWLAAAALLTGAPPAALAVGDLVQIVPVAGGLSDPIGIANAGDGSGRLFIVERCGRIRVFQAGALSPTVFLDLGATGADRIACGGERGLLGLAFHPEYEENGRFYVYYTRKSDGDIVIARYQASADPAIANPASESVLLTIEHSSQANHNGGQLAFGPDDGYLYAAVGDGGGGGDFLESGQSLNTLLGKILRFDVDGGSPYAIPAGNPFAGATPGRDEIWAYGLRNPWRFSFDRQTGDLYIGDVGQQTWEEIDFEPAASRGGVNYGWDCREGAHAYADPNGDLNANCGSGFTDPVLEYDHGLGCSVTGGFVLRNLPGHALHGSYLYGDFCSGRIWRAARGAGGGWSNALLFDTAFGISSFGESEGGRLYLTDLFSGTLQWLAAYTFQDVPPTHWAWAEVEALNSARITLGCGAEQYCPERTTTRAEAALFLVRAIHGADFIPPSPTGTVFADVPVTHSAAAAIEQLAADGVTRGCQSAPALFCPGRQVTRAEIAVMLLRAEHGAVYVPPPGTGTVFSDVPAGYWAVDWIEQLAAEGLTTGCGGGRYCPDDALDRAQTATFLTRTFALPRP